MNFERTSPALKTQRAYYALSVNLLICCSKKFTCTFQVCVVWENSCSRKNSRLKFVKTGRQFRTKTLGRVFLPVLRIRALMKSDWAPIRIVRRSWSQRRIWLELARFSIVLATVRANGRSVLENILCAEMTSPFHDILVVIFYRDVFLVRSFCLTLKIFGF